jgi:hypothetical protein
VPARAVLENPSLRLADRCSPWLAIGGGVASDTAGFLVGVPDELGGVSFGIWSIGPPYMLRLPASSSTAIPPCSWGD